MILPELPPRLVYIKWRDAHDIASGEWVEITEPVECLIETVGHLVLETELFVVITHTRATEDGKVRGGFAIPKCCIIGTVVDLVTVPVSFSP